MSIDPVRRSRIVISLLAKLARAVAGDPVAERFHAALHRSYVPPALLVDAAGRIVSATGDIGAFVRRTANVEGSALATALRDDVGEEACEVVRAALAAGEAVSGLVILLRRGPLTCRLVATPFVARGKAFASLAFEAPLPALAARRLEPVLPRVSGACPSRARRAI